jgi:Globin
VSKVRINYAAGLDTSMLQQVSYQKFSLVLESWEAAKQRHSCAEEIGLAILFELFRTDESAQTVFGFQAKSVKEIESSPLLRMGLLVHGNSIVKMFDGVLGLLGPDLDCAEEMLQLCAKRHVKFGVKPKHFGSLNVAVRQALKRAMGAAYSADMDEAWKEVLSETSKTIIRAMA